MVALETPTRFVTKVSFPGDAPAEWHGQFGGAPVVRGEAFAITSDGKKHAL